jgi:DNA-binding transcriptional LysR family regulator
MDLTRVDLNLLVALDALLAERHVTRAGQRLHLSQSATSAALRRLRRVFDDPLLVAHGRELQLTPLARALAEPVRDILSRIEKLTDNSDLLRSGLPGRTFTILSSEYVALVLLRRVLEHLSDLAPGVRVNLEPLSDNFREHLQNDDVDFVIAPVHNRTAQGVRHFPHVVVLRDRYVAAVCKRHPQVGDELTVEQFSTLPYLDYVVRRGEHAGSLLTSELDARDVPHTVHATTTSYALLPFLLRDTQMVAFLPELLATELADAAQVRTLESPVPLPDLVETMYWHPRRDSTDPAHAWLRRQILTAMEEPTPAQ